MKIFIINLESSIQRRAKIQKNINSISTPLDIEFFNAVNGNDMKDNEISSNTRELCEATTKGEIGCALSHINVYRKIVTDNIPVALILEDDVIIPDDIGLIVEDIEKTISDNEVILLNKPKQYLNKEIRPLNKYKVFPIAEADLTCSYVITNKAARRMIAFLYPVWLVADRWPLIREYKITSVNCLIPAVIQLNEESSITTITERKASSLMEETSNDIWRKIRKNRPLRVKINIFFWRLFIRKFYNTTKNQ